jgi:two-component system, chemotaxis family, protein-glutamate methylesterase/glutaminase
MENLSKDKPVRQHGQYKAVVIGVSAGGLKVLGMLLPLLPAGFPLPVIVVQHLHPLQDHSFLEILDRSCALVVKEAEEKEKAVPGVVYFAPPNYHLLIESDATFSLSVDEKVNYSRPSIDVLFETAAEAFGPGLIGIILTGAGKDGAVGLRRTKENGGITIVQDPATAQFPIMPMAAMEETEVDHVMNIEEIARFLSGLISNPYL